MGSRGIRRRIFVSTISSKAVNVFGTAEKCSLEQGIQLMADWVKRHGARESSVFKDIEILKNLPPSWRVTR